MTEVPVRSAPQTGADSGAVPFWPTGMPRALIVPRSSLSHNLRVTSERFPDKVAVWHYGREVTFAELQDQAVRLAGHLQARGVRRGDRVLVWMQNSPQFVVACHAAWHAGAVVVPLNPMLTAEELQVYLQDAGVRVGMVGAELYLKARAAGVEHVVVAAYGEGLDLSASPVEVPDALRATAQPAGDDVTWADALSGEPGEPVATGPDDLVVMPYTSGTTGKPKGCMHTNATVQSNIVGAATWHYGNQEDVSLGTLPLFHVTGMIFSMLVPVYAGNTTVLMTRWDRHIAAQLIDLHGCTLWTNTATMVIDFLANPRLNEFSLRSLRIMGGGGAPLPEAVGRHLQEKVGIHYLEGYGLSETIAQTHFNPVARPKLQCLGLPSFGLDAIVIDPESLAELPVGEVGEIAVSGPQVFLGYWQKPEATAEVFFERGGRKYFRTGDLGRRDAEGYFFMVDRLKRMINAAGFKVWPAEVETTLFRHPAVQEACVIAAPDAHRGETVRALVVLRAGQSATAQDIVDFAREHLAAYKVPREVVFVESLPRGGTGKVAWRQLQEEAWQAARTTG